MELAVNQPNLLEYNEEGQAQLVSAGPLCAGGPKFDSLVWPQLHAEKQSTEGERERKMSAPSASGLLDKSDDYFELTRRFVNN